MAMTDLPENIQRAFQVLYLAGVFDVQEGKATIHIKAGAIMGVQIESWAYHAPRELSTPSPLSRKQQLP